MPAVKDQRISIAVFESKHATNQNNVVTTIVTMLSPALEYC